MQSDFYELFFLHKLKKKKRIGRGGKRGTYSGRGIKGQKSRAGRKFAPVIRGLIKRYPKLRGYRFKAEEKNLAVVNVEVLDKKFDNSELTPCTFLTKLRQDGKRRIRRSKESSEEDLPRMDDQ